MRYMRFLVDHLDESGQTAPQAIPKGGIIRASLAVKDKVAATPGAGRALLYLKDDAGKVFSVAALSDDTQTNASIADFPPVAIPPGFTFWWDVELDGASADLTVAYLSEA